MLWVGCERLVCCDYDDWNESEKDYSKNGRTWAQELMKELKQVIYVQGYNKRRLIFARTYTEREGGIRFTPYECS